MLTTPNGIAVTLAKDVHCGRSVVHLWLLRGGWKCPVAKVRISRMGSATRFIPNQSTQITEVVLVTDNILSGSSTSRVLAVYFDEQGRFKPRDEKEMLGLGNRDSVDWKVLVEQQDNEPLKSYIRDVWPERVDKCPPYPVIRRFNMPSGYAFYSEMLTHPDWFICLFVRKDETIR